MKINIIFKNNIKIHKKYILYKIKFSLILLLIVNAVSENNIYGIEYDHRYLLDILTFPSNKIPIGTYYFRIPVENLEKSRIRIEFKRNDIVDFEMKVCSFFQLPTDIEILSGMNSTELENTDSYYKGYHNFFLNVPTFKKQKKIKYLVFTFINKEVLNYLTFHINFSVVKKHFFINFYKY